MEISHNLERYGITYKGITVWVEIDYIKKNISLVESDGQAKKWLFAKRELKYMDGWQNILDAMVEAIDHAQARLEAYQDNKTKEFALLAHKLSESEKAEV